MTKQEVINNLLEALSLVEKASLLLDEIVESIFDRRVPVLVDENGKRVEREFSTARDARGDLENAKKILSEVSRREELKKQYPSTEEIIQEIETLYSLPQKEGGTVKQIAYARAIRARSIRNYRRYIDRCCRLYPDEVSRQKEVMKTAVAYFEGRTAEYIIDMCCSGPVHVRGKYITFSGGQ